MPIYEYECSQCGQHFDRRQDFHDEPAASCPVCQSKAKRVIHSVAVIYKGSGFYTTDYARKNSHSTSEEAPKPDKERAAPELTPTKAESTPPKKD